MPQSEGSGPGWGQCQLCWITSDPLPACDGMFAVLLFHGWSMMKYLICFNFEQFILIMESLYVGGIYIEL